ncbi:hypothetical protein Bbelb_243160 [Branchiostoma belcheri]|nr:hypothetical protein Bbelb_243160 [Branchiostoma belcheri]
MATAMISENGRSGVSSLFPPRRKEDSLHDYVRILVQRSKSNFFKDIDDDQLSRLPDHVRQRVPVTKEVYLREIAGHIDGYESPCTTGPLAPMSHLLLLEIQRRHNDEEAS